MMDSVQDLFNLFQPNFVPDIGFGNRRFASSDWPANKWERGVIFDPFFESPEHYMFGTQQAVFSVTRNIFGNAKPLARKGKKNSSEVVVFYRGHRGPTRNFSRRRLFETPSPRSREDPALWAWTSDGSSSKLYTASARFRPVFGGRGCKISDKFHEFRRAFESLIHQIEGL